MKRTLSILALLAIPFVFAYVLPTPKGLSESAWVVFGIYIAAILGLVFRPIPNSMVLITAVAGVSLFMGPYLGGAKKATQKALSGYASATTWIIVSAFAISIAFVKTGLGKRIAYLLIGALGKTSLRLGYVAGFLDLLISPATPSNTARAGGIVFPIVNSTAQSLGNKKTSPENRTGAFLACNAYMTTKVSSFVFATAMAGNLLVIESSNMLLKTDLNWGNWAAAMIIPGLACMIAVPAICYFLIRPDVKDIDNKAIAKQGLEELGPMKNSEKYLVLIFILALIGWSAPSICKSLFNIKLDINATAVALGAMSSCVLFNVIKFEDIAGSKECVGTLLWFGGILSLSSMLRDLKFFEWLGQFLQSNLNLTDINPTIALILIGLVSIFVRYLFASATVYITTLLPVFFLLGLGIGINPYILSFVLIGTNSYGGNVTHYGGPAAPIIFGAGYNTVKEWWIAGLVCALSCFAICLAIGIPVWKIMGY